MHRTRTARAIAVPRRSDDIQPAAIFGTLGVIAGLLLAWTGLVL